MRSDTIVSGSWMWQGRAGAAWVFTQAVKRSVAGGGSPCESKLEGMPWSRAHAPCGSSNSRADWEGRRKQRSEWQCWDKTAVKSREEKVGTELGSSIEDLLEHACHMTGKACTRDVHACPDSSMRKTGRRPLIQRRGSTLAAASRVGPIAAAAAAAAAGTSWLASHRWSRICWGLAPKNWSTCQGVQARGNERWSGRGAAKLCRRAGRAPRRTAVALCSGPAG